MYQVIVSRSHPSEPMLTAGSTWQILSLSSVMLQDTEVITDPNYHLIFGFAPGASATKQLALGLPALASCDRCHRARMGIVLVPSVAICSPCSAVLAWSSPFPSHYKPLLCQPQTQLLLFA